MTATIDADICVIGGGSAGLSVAAGTAQLGLRTVLIEGGEMGGDCLNTGCVPSKALLSVTASEATARTDGTTRRARINAYVQRAQAAIAPHDSQERFEDLGVTVLRSRARFTGPDTVAAGDTTITARNFVIAVGSRAGIPPIPGLDPEKVLTNETIFDVDVVLDHIVIIGGGPIGMEMAQAHRQMGSRVSVVERDRILAKDDPELAAVVRDHLLGQGVDIFENVEVQSVEHPGATEHVVTILRDGEATRLDATHLLVAAGRRPNVDDLGLEAAGIKYSGRGIDVDKRLRTSNSRVFAIGDVAGGPQFTHIAGYHGSIVVQNIAFRIPAKVDYAALPWVTYTDPELAHVGMTYEAARAQYGDKCQVLKRAFNGLDRAQTSGGTSGIAKAIVTSSGRILGCSIVGPHAGELIGLWALAITKRMTLRDLTKTILPYPTYNEIAKQLASDFYKPKLFSSGTRRMVKWLALLPRF